MSRLSFELKAAGALGEPAGDVVDQEPAGDVVDQLINSSLWVVATCSFIAANPQVEKLKA